MNCKHCVNGYLNSDIECKNGILIDLDEYLEGPPHDHIYPPAPCHPNYCVACGGTGHIADDGDCKECGGSGYIGGKNDSRSRLGKALGTSKIHETQKTIGQWGSETFGVATVPEIASRVVCEAGELMRVAAKAVHPDDFSDAQRAALADEAADVAIFLKRIAHICGFNLDQEVDVKMGINRKRVWGKSADGRRLKLAACPDCGNMEKQT